MLEFFNKLFTQYVKLAPEYWGIIFVGVIALAFAVTLIIGLTAGRFNTVKRLMKKAASSPSSVVKVMKNMPVSIKKQYKLARVLGKEPSAYVTERDCVTDPYNNSIISKLWLVTFVATVICTLLAFFIVPLAMSAVEVAEGVENAAASEQGSALAVWSIPAFVAAVGGLLTLVSAIIGKCAYAGAVKAYAKFVPAIDADSKNQTQGVTLDGQGAQPLFMDQSPLYAGAPAFNAQPVQNGYDQQQSPLFEGQSSFTEQHGPQVQDPSQDYFEPPVQVVPEQNAGPINVEPVSPVIVEPAAPVTPQPSPEEIKRKEREERDAARMAAAQAYAAEQAAARRAASEQAANERAAKAAQAQQAAPTGSSSADEVIARIEQIDREGAPRETMREVAALLQRERAKPENKNPEQQKKLNDALSKLLKAMSAANRK